MSWLPSKGYCVLDRPHIATKKNSQNTAEHRLLQICNPLGTGIQPFQIFSSFSCLARSSGASTTMPSATSTCTSFASVSSSFLLLPSVRPSRSLWRSLVADPSFLGSALYLSGSVLFAAMPYWSAASPATMTKMGQAQPGTVTALAAVASW